MYKKFLQQFYIHNYIDNAVLVLAVYIHVCTRHCCKFSHLMSFALHAPCTDAYPSVSVRLVDGLTAAEGRVEVNYQGTWGTVCNDSSWDLNDAMVVCGMLGYTSVLAAHVKYGQGSGSVWMSNLACTGSENSISECPHIGWGETSCSHSQDAGVTCGSEY